jgi:hypothetical protein
MKISSLTKFNTSLQQRITRAQTGEKITSTKEMRKRGQNNISK